ncbi:DUF3299 domain-containing protein [Pseudomonas sp. F1_0610]|uniref:DUF3299 domain-containing protein n=1 Tax=Pseudomonas sp. F1_0610 TaxID=3114284 RepID=UPI0039C12598
MAQLRQKSKQLTCAFILSLFAMLVQAQPGLDWLELLPPEDLQALLDMPEIGHDTPEGDSTFYSQGLKNTDPDLPEIMRSTRTVAALNNQPVLIAGYPVPLESDENGHYQEFFLVPYPGACIHVPPPPPNQIILVRFAKGYQFADIYEPIWVEGRLYVDQQANDLADSSYRLEAESVTAIDAAF